eukprot:scaffold803_cov310-Pinguiococcus_pyrenoidosus.AAC.79
MLREPRAASSGLRALEDERRGPALRGCARELEAFQVWGRERERETESFRRGFQHQDQNHNKIFIPKIDTEVLRGNGYERSLASAHHSRTTTPLASDIVARPARLGLPLGWRRSTSASLSSS